MEGVTKYIQVKSTPSQRWREEFHDIFRLKENPLPKILKLNHHAVMTFLLVLSAFIAIHTFIVFRATFSFIVIAVQLGDITSFNNWHRNLLLSVCIVGLVLRIFLHRRVIYLPMAVAPIADFLLGTGWLLAALLDAIQLIRFQYEYGFFWTLLWPYICLTGDVIAHILYTVSMFIGLTLIHRYRSKKIWPVSHSGKTFYEGRSSVVL